MQATSRLMSLSSNAAVILYAMAIRDGIHAQRCMCFQSQTYKTVHEGAQPTTSGGSSERNLRMFEDTVLFRCAHAAGSLESPAATNMVCAVCEAGSSNHHSCLQLM